MNVKLQGLWHVSQEFKSSIARVAVCGQYEPDAEVLLYKPLLGGQFPSSRKGDGSKLSLW